MIRPPAVSATFYSGNPDTLVKDINSYLHAAKIEKGIFSKGNPPFGFVVPHAGYAYSGATAAHAYKMMQGMDFDTAILLGPSHHAFIEGNSVFPNGAYETPLGKVPIDDKIAASLLKKKGMTDSIESQYAEHSLEVQIPFLQVIKKNLKIVPILIGDYSLANLQQLSANLLEVIDEFRNKKIMFIVSTDLSHYHSSEAADKMDRIFIDYFHDFKLKEMIAGLNENKIEACGSGPVIALMLLAKTLNKTSVEILEHTNSARASGDHKRVVGYFSAVIY